MNKNTNKHNPQKNNTTQALWGKQTTLSLQYFNIGQHQFSIDFINVIINIKRACAQVNHQEGLLAKANLSAILLACDELLLNDYSAQFPLSVWQTGSGTQTNMNVNEVICSLANKYNAQASKENNAPVQEVPAIHANDHVNMSQSSNDVFPSAMHIVVAKLSQDELLKSLAQLASLFDEKSAQFTTAYAVGRTHLMDALPIAVSGVFSGYSAQLSQARTAILEALTGLFQLAIGGTAVGGGDNAPADFGKKVAEQLAQYYQLPFVAHSNTYAAVSGEDALLRFSSALKQLAGVLFKIANDFKLLGSGPRCGFNEWLLPANEPGSSIMPGKVNPTQCEALSMVCLQVFGNDLTVSMAATNGQLQLNTYRPVIIHNVMESIELLTDAMSSFANHCLSAMTLNEAQLSKNMQQNLSAITLLAPDIGYDVAASIVNEANDNNTSLAEAAQSLGLYSGAEFDAMMLEKLSKNASGN